MSQLNPIAAEAGQGTHEPASAEAQTPANGVAANSAPTCGSVPEAAQRPALKRAEALADRLALQFGVVSTVVTESLKRFVARAREEAEDLWAEAQHIRKGIKP
jgi:hypothetical protein